MLESNSRNDSKGNDSLKVVMIVAGTDSSGGAGLAADIATCRLLQAYPMPVVSCVTSQNSKGLRRIQPVDLEIFQDQLEAILTDVRPDAVKVGMLPSIEHMRILAEMLALYPHGPVVFDPIISPTLGAENFNAEWMTDRNTLSLFMSQVFLITPNADELKALVAPVKATGLIPVPEFNENIDSKSLLIFDMHILRMTYGVNNLLLTGGHNKDEDRFTDFLLCSRDEIEFPSELNTELDGNDDLESSESPSSYEIGIIKGEEVDTPNTHGTGCVYSTAISSFIAQGLKLQLAVPLAKQILTILLKSGKDWRLYKNGHGPAFSLLSLPQGDMIPPSLQTIPPSFLN